MFNKNIRSCRHKYWVRVNLMHGWGGDFILITPLKQGKQFSQVLF